MNVEELEKFGLEIKEEYKQGIFLIDVFTVWCGPCKFVKPILEELEQEGLISLAAVDLDKHRELGSAFGITAIPTLLFFKDGKLLEGSVQIEGRNLVNGGIMVGAAPKNVLLEIIKQI